MIIESLIVAAGLITFASIKYSFDYLKNQDEKEKKKNELTFQQKLSLVLDQCLEIFQADLDLNKCPYCKRNPTKAGKSYKFVNPGIAMFCHLNHHPMIEQYDSNVWGPSAGFSVWHQGKHYFWQGCNACRSQWLVRPNSKESKSKVKK